MEESPELEAATQAEYSHRDKLMTASVKWAPLFHRIHGMSVIVIPDFSQYIDLPWHRVLILKIIMLTVKDRGSQILFEPCRSKDPGDESAIDLKITYEVDGKSYDLVPPPGEIWPLMVQEFEAIAGLISFRHRLAAWLHKLAHRIDGQPLPHREGHFHLHVGDETTKVELVAWPSALGEHIELTMPPASASLSHRVQTEMLQLIETSELRKHKNDTPPKIL